MSNTAGWFCRFRHYTLARLKSPGGVGHTHSKRELNDGLAILSVPTKPAPIANCTLIVHAKSWKVFQTKSVVSRPFNIPKTMRAVVYRGANDLRLETPSNFWRGL